MGEISPSTPSTNLEESYQSRLNKILTKPTFESEVYAHIANGGDLITLTENLDIRYSDLREWLLQGNGPSMLAKAVEARQEWVKQRILNELKHIALLDIRQAFNENGSLKPPSEWPESIARALTSVETDQLFIGAGKDREQVGETKKVKFNDKVKALQLMGQEFGLFVQKHKVEVVDKLEDLVEQSREEQPKDNPPKPAA